MRRPSSRSVWLLLGAGLLASGCAIPGDDRALSRVDLRPAARPAAQAGNTASSIVEEASSALPPVPAPTTTVAPEPSASATTSTPVLATVPVTPPAAPAPTTTTAVRPRVVVEQAWTPFAAAGSVTLFHPSSRVERVGFHQSNHEGAQQLEPLPAAVAPATMEARHRLTGSRTAADVVIDPAVEVRAPVSGTVKRAGTYVLYCEHSDDFVVIEPDARPGWEVKVLHIDGVQVAAGDRVMAGETVIAGGPTPLPFESQVDELTTAATAWPHVHIEVIDLAIPDIPSPGSGC